MKKIKKALALLLSFSLVLGMIPASAITAFGASGTTEHLFFATDRHANTSVIGNIINNMESVIGENELDYLGLGGDMVGSGNSHPAYNSSTVLSEVTGATSSLSSTNVDIVAGIHDMNVTDDAGIVLPYQGGGAKIYEGTNYYVYGVEEYCISEDSNESNWSTQAQAFVTWANGTEIDKSKAIFVLSHYPLHVNRNDNDGAYYWHQALNTVATGSATGTEVIRDVAFFHGHNHTVDSKEYVYNVGDTMSIQNGSSTKSDIIQYTYATAGYLNQNGKATLVTIDADSIEFTKYSTSGSGTAMASVERVSTGTEEVALESISISGKTEYTVGEELAITVTANYSDGKTKDVTSEATITGADMSTAGNYTVKAVHESKEATIEITVKSADSSDEEDTDSSTDITLLNPTTATVSGATTTESKDVYVLVSTPTAGNQYIIASGNSAGSVNALKENTTTGTSVTVNAEGNGISAPYIETTDETIMWNTASGMTFQSENGSYYLRYNNGLAFSTRSSTNWTVDTNSAYYNYYNYRKYYLYNNNGTWGTSSSSAKVYFFEKQTVEVSTSVNGTYSIKGEPSEVSKVVVAGTTATLGSTLTFVPESSTATTTDTSTTATYTEFKDENDVISEISGNTVTFTGNYGTAYVKVSYTVTVGGVDYTVDNYIKVEATAPTYKVDITKDGKSVEGTLSVKGVTNGQTLQLGQIVTYETADGEETIKPKEGTIEWDIPEEYKSIATIDAETGEVTFKGVTGTFTVTVSYEIEEGHSVTDTITISANTTSYTTPSDGTSDFPEYPNEGAIRFDKTAQAVGNFSETGIVKMELSMTGVPYTTGSEIDVVLMLDMTGSMDDVTSSTSEPTGYTRVDATIASAKVFVKSIVVNEDGSYNNNRVGIYVFNKNGAATLYDFGVINTDAKLEGIIGKVGASGEEFASDYTEGTLDTIYEDHYASGGTPYDDGLAKCQEVLTAAKTDGVGNNRQQFTVFMTDGVPTSYAYVNGTTYGTHSSASAIAGMLTSSSDYATRDTDYKYEYYSTEMKKAGVTVYTVGIGLNNTNNAWSGTATQCNNLASALLNDISGPANETSQPDVAGTSTLSKKNSYFFSVDDATASTDMKTVFSNIAQKILQAATDVTVEDKITDEYTMIFDIPEGTKDITGVTNDFYIDFLEYALDENNERSGAGTSKMKVYLANSDGTYYAASNNTGTKYSDPVFEAKAIGEKGTAYYWTNDSTVSNSGISITVAGITYYFVADGIKSTDDDFDATKWFNMTSGAYANGTVDATTNMSEDVVIATPYYVYDASTRVLYWTVDKLGQTEYALNYFLYLDNSATEIGTAKEVDAATYPTNEYAHITYTNFNGNDCRQNFPKPQMTWNGAQVSYVFYLVNAAGQPINKSGQVVDFANATFITDTYTESVVWNKGTDGVDGSSELNVNWLAKTLLPDNYTVYDESANYKLQVYATNEGEAVFNYFTISGSASDAIASSLNSRLEGLNVEATDVSIDTTKVYNTKSGTKYDDYGTYTSAETDSIANEIVLKDFDFANTTVAFAVVWQPTLMPDTIVVDYGLPVDINVVQNDLMQNAVTGIGLGRDAYGNVAMNTGVSTDSKFGTAALTTGAGNSIKLQNENTIRYTLNDMVFAEPDVFYYESPVEFYEGSEKQEGYMHSSVTVIPATTVYYEDSFVTYTDSTAKYSESDETTGEETAYGSWITAGESISTTQASDRPGKSQISAALDADNNYGYDAAYDNCTEYSMGSAKKVTVNAETGKNGVNPTANFTFYGTGFDLVSLTDNTSGLIMVTVMDATGKTVKSMAVNNYYGYKYVDGKWNLVTDKTNNALYQVPVIQITNLPQSTYTVKVDVAYLNSMDNTGNNEYNFWLDAVRIYNPASTNNEIVRGAYTADGELNPDYIELRDLLLAADALTADSEGTQDGVVFVDGIPEADIANYEAVGPNNEVYLENGQAVAFKMIANDIPSGIQIGAKLADGNFADLYLNNSLFETLNSATDRNYVLNGITWTETAADSGVYESNVVVLSNNTEGSIISLTNLKAINATFVLSNSAEAVSAISLVEETESPVEISVVSSYAMARTAIDMLNSMNKVVFVPESITASWAGIALAGQKTALTVTTSEDVNAISVNGAVITEYKTVWTYAKSAWVKKRVWTYTMTAPAKGTYEYDVIAYDADGNESEPIATKLTVKGSILEILFSWWA